ncbi:hypothetical protein ACFL45_10905 [Candidatus Neomarinimicrobiota bacterium]
MEKRNPEGFRIALKADSIFVIGGGENGALYGVMDLIEQLGPEGKFDKIKECEESPALSFRAIKFNLPWAPYRKGFANDVHLETVRDLKYWEAFLDMMVENRFNALTLWSTHIFPYMFRADNYPKATPYSDQELLEWKSFWKGIFGMAKERGIETFMLNWNIVVSPEFAEAYGATVHFDRSDLVKKYTRECVTQLINEYGDLTGVGVTLSDWMGNWGEPKMTSQEREDWIQDTFVEGMKNANRTVKFIHRSVLAGDPKEMREVIDYADLPDKTIVEVKFNWSHGYSTPVLSITHSNDAGAIMSDFWEPLPENYFIAWQIRNEDFFVLRWGEPEFIREHIALNNKEYVDGYFVGSEGYIPAKDYSHADHPHKTWNYAFEKQWLFYKLWGRLTYYPAESDETFAKAFEIRYPGIDGNKLLKAYTLASRMPLALATFYRASWDFTLYSEGFLAPWTKDFDDHRSPFISLEELMKHKTLDARYLSIGDYGQMMEDGVHIDEEYITPIELANKLYKESEQALAIVSELRTDEVSNTLESELDDVETWCHLGFYLAQKLYAGVALDAYERFGNPEDKQTAVQTLEYCVVHWKNVIRLTDDRYKPMPYVSMGHDEPRDGQPWPDFKEYHWKFYLEEVEYDLEFAKNFN